MTPPGSPTLAVLLLGDGRLPAGGHAHSAGVEAAVVDGRVADLATLAAYLEGRLWTAGLTEAALAAATVVRVGPGGDGVGALAALDAEADARVVAGPLRAASRRLGAQLLRVAGRCWPSPVLVAAGALDRRGPHQPVALGAAVAAAGAGPADAAALAVHHALATPAQAAVRLLGLDPFEAVAAVAGLGAGAAAVVAEAVAAAGGPPADLPCRTGAAADIAAVHHAGCDRRLFAT